MNNGNDKYTIGQYLVYTPAISKGIYSKVYYGRDKFLNSVAIKIIKKQKVNPSILKYIYQEIDIMRKVKNHINIINFREQIENDKYIYIISDYCNYSTLSSLFDKILYENDILHVFKQIVNALLYIRTFNIYHKDLKPANVLMHVSEKLINTDFDINDIVIKLGDFGFSKQIEQLDSLNETLCGTPLYLAPEILIDHKYDDKSDLWSLGIILFQLMYHFLPFGEPTNKLELVKRIKLYENSGINIIEFGECFCPWKKYKKSPYNVNISDDLKQLVIELLTIRIHDRISWTELKNNKWINSEIKKEKKEVNKSIEESMLESVLNLKEEGREKKEKNSLDILRDKIKDNYLSGENREKENKDSHIEINNISDISKLKIIDNYYIPRSQPITINSEVIKVNRNNVKGKDRPSSLPENSPITSSSLPPHSPSISNSFLSFLKHTLRYVM
jgi:serine/threonine protein kinase